MKPRLFLVLKVLLVLVLFNSCDKSKELKATKIKLEETQKNYTSIKDKFKKSQDNCDPCKISQSDFDRNAYHQSVHFKLGIQCDQSDVNQFFHSDYRNGYTILGQIKSCVNGYVKDIDFHLIKDGCDNLYLKNVTWQPYKSEENPNITHALIMHVVDTNLETAENDSTNQLRIKNTTLYQFRPTEGIQFEKNNLSVLYITSNNSNLGHVIEDDRPFPKLQIDAEIECPTIQWKG